MSDQTEDFKEDIIVKYSESDLNSILALIDTAFDDKESGSNDGWEMSLSKEKHDALNYTYHVSLWKADDEDECVELSFYTGIDVGCELIDYSLGGLSLADKPMMQRVMYDLELDLSKIKNGVNISLAQIILDGAKEEIMDIYSKQGYDNYVTGGGTSVTNKHYKEKIEKFNNLGLYWNCLYREEEFDRNIC